MRTNTQEPQEVIEFLRRYIGEQQVIVTVGRKGAGSVTGDLMGVDDVNITVLPDTDGTEVIICRSDITSVSHDRVFERAFAEVAF